MQNLQLEDASVLRETERWQGRGRLRRFFIVIGVGLILAFMWLNTLAQPAWADDYDRVNLSHHDFSGQDLRDSSFTLTNLRNSDLSHANFEGVSLFGSKFKGANLEGANLSYTTLDSAELVNTNLDNADLEGAFAHMAQFQGTSIKGADFTDVDLRPDAQDLLCDIAEGTNPTTHRETRVTLNCD